MFVMMLVSFYTSRIVLDTLGEDDYGLYNVIGGVVVLFSFLNSALLQGTQRFLNFALGKSDLNGAHDIFCMSMNLYIILSVVFFMAAETIGLWFVNTHLNIPQDRMYAANWVYQFSIIAFIVNLIRVPYNAAIIAYEEMSFFAYLSIVEVVLKLLVVYMIIVCTFDKLIFFALLYTIIPLLLTYAYKFYCNRKYFITRYKYYWDKTIYKKLFSFSGWNLFGGIANMLASQGLVILVNVFHGVAANAAMGLANQVSAKVFQFVTNFQIAFNPQIVKLYASKQKEDLYQLMFRASKLSYYLMLLISLPIILEVDTILGIWLVKVPQYTAIFCQLMLCFILIETVAGPLWMYVQATGVIRNYQLLMSFLIFLNFPIVYVVLKVGFPIYSVWIVRIIVNVIVFSTRCAYLGCVYSFPISRYLRMVLVPIVLVSILAVPLPTLISSLNLSNLNRIISTTIVSMFSTSIFVYVIGLTNNEKKYLIHLVRKAFIHGE